MEDEAEDELGKALSGERTISFRDDSKKLIKSI
jgi:hypothetical protein